MSNIKNWLKNYKSHIVLAVIVTSIFFIYDYIKKSNVVGFTTESYAPMGEQMLGKPNILMGRPVPVQTTPDRMVITETSLSLVVKNVSDAINSINSFVKNLNGFMVNSSQNTSDDVTSGTITVRVPSEKLNETMSYFKSMAVKMVDENVQGNDITDQYADYQERIKTLENTKSKYQVILDKATSVEDILNVTNQIIEIQTQIDSIKGTMQYLESTSKTSLITVSLSTDEFELPYTPDKTWRINVVFKEAVRALVLQLRSLAASVVWIGVFSVIWVPALLIVWLIVKKTKSVTKK